ncbi:phage holin [Virgibacillus sp. W0430]|uniref:phage holin n=1 Tax=Virgibacillus sp. W0430 TaxID=3391580 RepID=UPI003F44670A
MDRGTVIRTATLLLALTNQFLVIFGKSPLPIESEVIEHMSALMFTTVTSVIAWYKNNYVTKTGKMQKEILTENGLTNKKREKRKK